MTSPDRRRCYVAMPFGTKPDLDGSVVDFDEIYFKAIRPAIESAGLTPTRADSLLGRGIVQKEIISAVLGSEVMIADLTTNNPNTLYELGLRHASRRNSTIILCSDSSRLPFDLAMLSRITYRLQGGHLNDVEAAALSEHLVQELKRSNLQEDVDSPAFTFFPGLQVSLPHELARKDEFRGRDVERLRRRLLEAVRLMAREERLPVLREVEEEVLPLSEQEPSLAIDLLLAFRDSSAWDEVINLFGRLPAVVRERSVVLQQTALALNRRKKTGDRERAVALLEQLLAHIGADSETYGLLGRIYKDLYKETSSEEHLNLAIETYRKGWKANANDYYPGINLATLLHLKGDPASLMELNRLLPDLRSVVSSAVKRGSTGYWDVATSLELACLARDWEAAESLVLETRLRAASPWMVETTARNLELIESHIDKVEDRQKLQSILKKLIEGAAQ